MRAPGKTIRDTTWLRGRPIAHRGLHDLAAGVAENSLTAFKRAIAAGMPFEIDVRLSKDGEAIVFHDETLDRLTLECGPLRHRTAEELREIKICGTDDHISTLSEVLAMTAGRVPVLIEIKAPTRKVGRLEARVAEILRGYEGAFAIQSFNPLVVDWFKRHEPDMIRGLLASAYKQTGPFKVRRRVRFTLRHLLCAPMIRPHFIAYDVDALPAVAPRIARWFGLPLLAWTVASEQQRKIGAKHADNIIFEGFRPGAV